jgi:hypothetical protein
MSNEIICNNYRYTNDDIISGNCYLSNSLAAEELGIDTLNATLNLVGIDHASGTIVPGANLAASDGDILRTADGEEIIISNPLSGYLYGDTVTYSHDSGLVGKFKFEKAIRTAKTQYGFSCISSMGILDNLIHYGGIYTEEPAGDIIADIMGDIPYTIYDEVSTVTLNGWLPVATRRENLQQVLFATGAGIFKDSEGNLIIKYVTTPAAIEISNDRIYMSGTVDYQTPCTRVDVTEHAYHALSGDTVVTLFDTSDAVTSETVLFDNPCHDLAVTGLSIESSGVNYAIVSGTGTLTGKEYTHTTRVLSSSTGVGGAENVVSVTDATLVSTFNSYNVALRVAQYFSAVSIDTIGVVFGTERPTDVVEFNDPFFDDQTGYIKSMNINISGTLKADTDVAIGFLPTGQGNNYNNHVVLTNSDSWSVPSDVTRVYAILVGGGTGGNGGDPGENGNVGITIETITAGDGGDGGTGGTGGLIYISNLTVTPSASISYACGTGGTGGAESTSGNAGTATTFGAYSSASGRTYPNGYSEPKSGLTLGTSGVSGVNGGAGRDWSSPGDASDPWPDPDPGENVTYNSVTYVPGNNGDNYYLGAPNYTLKAVGGGGAGPAVGSNGGNGTAAAYNPYLDKYENGDGGNGANANAGDNATNYGGGGQGGHGGGGGGFAFGNIPELEDDVAGHAGDGGNGGAGGTGGDGCIIIYY